MNAKKKLGFPWTKWRKYKTMVLFFCYSVISIVCDFYFFFAYRSSTKWYTFLWCMDILLVTISIYVYIFLWIDRALQKLEKKEEKNWITYTAYQFSYLIWVILAYHFYISLRFSWLFFYSSAYWFGDFND